LTEEWKKLFNLLFQINRTEKWFTLQTTISAGYLCGKMNKEEQQKRSETKNGSSESCRFIYLIIC